MSIPISTLYQIADESLLTALTDDEATGTPDEQILAAALLTAAGEVRAALVQGGYDPEAGLTPLLRHTAATLAVEALHARRRHIPPGDWTRRAADARALLGRIATGRFALPEFPPPGPTVHHAHEPDRPLQRLRNMRNL